MTLEEFSTVTRTRIPTPQEFVDFVQGQGWKINHQDGRASLRAPRSDAVAVMTAKMLSREPYRTNVLAEVQRRWRQAETPAEVQAEKTVRVELEHTPQVCDITHRVREWRWNSGHTYTSDGTESEAWHPVGAWWWRYQGETEWREIPERVPYLRCTPPEYVPSMRCADRFQTAERR